jgi:ribonucleotide monophosphatase NagD (HAD superfamily)
VPHTQLFGWKALRFLFVTNSPGRAAHMRQALTDLTHAQNERQLFYFTHADAIAKGNALRPVWIDGNGMIRSLI